MATMENPDGDNWEPWMTAGIYPGGIGETSSEALGRRLLDSLVNEAVREMDLPHAVMCIDQATNAVSFSGPYPNGIAALCAAEAEHLVERGHDSNSSMAFSVVALLPAVVAPS